MALSAVNIVRVFATIFQSLGILLTVWRIYFRARIGRFWWEDAWATLSLFAGLLYMIDQWSFLLTYGLTSIITSWIYSMSFTCLVTFVRMSILFSIIRIIHGSPRLLKFTYACAAFFVACWIVLVVEKVYQCASDPSWHNNGSSTRKPFCYLKARISIIELTTDCVAVSILVALPLQMLWRVKLPRRQRRMILAIFASSTLLAVGALFHTLGQVLNMFVMMVVGVNVEVALSIIVCNLLVVVTYTYRFLHERESSEVAEGSTEASTSLDDDFTTRPTQSRLNLTSVDLDVSLSCQDTSGVSRSV